ncbi:Hint domain-containing protein [uncultured Tateyamaria sp.]|uniref:Hint domain-containing protein n=1 Tax=uncultured Tateyamaria sp. TaxID=455651 RepID=UPI00260D70BF|nr:Hint domain-containing protein [uncultured Tateyamaria sp.]
MPVFLTITDSDITNAAFWTALDIGQDSTIDASGISSTINITLTGSSISFEDTASGITTTYSDSDLTSGSFSQFVEFVGNDGDSDASGSVGLNASGYTGGSGDDIFTDDGSLGGGIRGGEGNDTLIGGVGSNNIDGGEGDDVLSGGGGNNNLSGGEGNDTLLGEDGSGNLNGGEGDDVIFAGLNTTFVEGGSGTDSMILPEGSTFTPFFPGSAGGNVTLPNGRSFVYLNIGNVTVACFAAGTPIRTPNGDVPVEHLTVGDCVMTLDRGPQPIKWLGQRTVNGLGSNAPIHFRPGSIGNSQALRLSPQHRVLLSGWKCELLFHSREVLCAAKHLCDGDQIFREPCATVTYVHFMFEQHEIVFSGNALLESFFVGDHITDAERGCHAELVDLFPELARHGPDTMLSVRPCLKAFEGSLLM